MILNILAASILLVPPVQDPGETVAVQADPFVTFAEKVETTIAQGDGTFMTTSFDLKGMVEKISADLDTPAAFTRGFRLGMVSTMKLGEGVADNIASYDGTYEFLRVMPDRPKRALFRLAGDDGLNYHELHLGQDADGTVRIVDAFLYSTGEPYSAIVRRGFVAAATSNDRSLISRLLGKDSDYIRSLDDLKKLYAAQIDNPQRALKIYEGLPESVQSLPEALVARIQASSLVDNDLYLEALLDLAKFHPDSPALPLMMIDAHIIRGKYDHALANIDVIDKRVLGDPFLDILRGSILRQAGKLREAVRSVDRAVDRSPNLGYQALWEYLEISIAAQDHAKTLRCLVTLEHKHGVEWGDLTEFEPYAAFVASKFGKQWLGRK